MKKITAIFISNLILSGVAIAEKIECPVEIVCNNGQFYDKNGNQIIINGRPAISTGDKQGFARDIMNCKKGVLTQITAENVSGNYDGSRFLWCSYKVERISFNREDFRYFDVSLKYNIESINDKQPNKWVSMCFSKNPSDCSANLY